MKYTITALLLILSVTGAQAQWTNEQWNQVFDKVPLEQQLRNGVSTAILAKQGTIIIGGAPLTTLGECYPLPLFISNHMLLKQVQALEAEVARRGLAAVPMPVADPRK